MISTYNFCNTQVLNSSINGIYVCDDCGSKSIIEAGDGFVCTDCGLTIEQPVLKYNKPYQNDLRNRVQMKVMNSAFITTIGTKNERFKNPHSKHLERISKINEIMRDYFSFKLQDAREEVKRITECLHLPNITDDCINAFKLIWNSLKKRSKCRSPEKLIPVIIFMVAKVRSIIFNINDLIKISKIDKAKFRETFLKVAPLYPAYKKRDRKNAILKKLDDVIDWIFEQSKKNTDLSQKKEFKTLAIKVLYRFWPYFQTKDDIIVGTVSTLTLIGLNLNIITISKICNHIGIKMCSVNYQIGSTLFGKLKVPGFESTVKSSDLIRNRLITPLMVGNLNHQSSHVHEFRDLLTQKDMKIGQKDERLKSFQRSLQSYELQMNQMQKKLIKMQEQTDLLKRRLHKKDDKIKRLRDYLVRKEAQKNEQRDRTAELELLLRKYESQLNKLTRINRQLKSSIDKKDKLLQHFMDLDSKSPGEIAKFDKFHSDIRFFTYLNNRKIFNRTENFNKTSKYVPFTSGNRVLKAIN